MKTGQLLAMTFVLMSGCAMQAHVSVPATEWQGVPVAADDVTPARSTPRTGNNDQKVVGDLDPIERHIEHLIEQLQAEPPNLP